MQSKLNILHIEDNKVDQIQIKEILGNCNVKLTIMHADSIYEAQEVLSDRVFDIILLDLGLPDSIGYKTIQKVLSINNKTPVIALTNNKNVIIESQSLKAGAQDYLIKSQLNEELLIRSINNAITRQHGLVKLQDELSQLQAIKDIQQTGLIISNTGIWSLDLITNSMSWSQISSDILGIQHSPKDQSFLYFCSLFESNEQKSIRKWVESPNHNAESDTLEVTLKLNLTEVQTLILKKQIINSGSSLSLAGVITNKSDTNSISKKITNHAYQALVAEVFNNISFELNSQTQMFSQLNEWLEEEPDINFSQKIISSQILGEMSALSAELIGLSSLLKSQPSSKLQLTPRNFLSTLNSVLRTHSNKVKTIFAEESAHELWGMNSHGLLTSVKMLLGFLDKVQIPINEILVSLPSSNGTNKNKGTIEFKINHQLDKSLLKKQEETSDFTGSVLKSWLLKNESVVAICQDLLASIGGNLAFLHKGTLIQITWPIDIRFKNDTTKYEYINSDNLSFLIVDDHFIQRMAIKKIIQQLYPGANIDEAPDGLKAIDLFHEKNYNIIMMDIQMPGLNGFETARKLPEKYPGKIIAMTADLSPESRKTGANPNISEIISKPIKLDTIKSIVEKYIHISNTVGKL